MIHMQEYNTGFQDVFGLEKSMPLIQAFDYITNQMNDQNTTIGRIQEEFISFKKGEIDRKLEIKKDLLVELATKADIEKLDGKISTEIEKMNGKIDSLEQKMNGKIDSLEQKMNGKIDSLEHKMNGKIDSLSEKMNGKIDTLQLWMKMLVGVAILAVTCYSPMAQELIKLIKF